MRSQQLLVFHRAHHARRIPHDDGALLHVARDDRSRADECVGADRDAGKNYAPAAHARGAQDARPVAHERQRRRAREQRLERLGAGLIGGAIGLGIAWPLTLLLQQYMPVTLSPIVVGLALLVSLATGVLSGFVPAWRAARMNPVDALRNE